MSYTQPAHLLRHQKVFPLPHQHCVHSWIQIQVRTVVYKVRLLQNDCSAENKFRLLIMSWSQCFRGHGSDFPERNISTREHCTTQLLPEPAAHSKGQQ